MTSPFNYRALNVLECLSLIVSIFTFYCGLAFNDENTSDGGKILLSVLLIGVNSALAIAFGLAVHFYADRFATAKLKSMDRVDVPALSFARMALLASLLFAQTASDLSARMRKLVMSQAPSFDHSRESDRCEHAEQRSVAPQAAQTG